jgi:hypothetical protein
MRSICIPASVEVIGNSCFWNEHWGDTELARVTFESCSKLKRIDEFGFHGCCQLTSLCIPASVEYIGGYCFCPGAGRASALETLTFESGSKLVTIGEKAFGGCERLRSICLPALVSKIDCRTFESSHFWTIEIEADNRSFCVRDHLILDFAEVLIVAHFGEDENVQIPDQIETIGPRAFMWQRFVQSVSFGSRSSLRFIKSGAFCGCGFASIDIPSSVEEIDEQAFESCSLISRVTFDRRCELKKIGRLAFASCRVLESFCVPSSVEIIDALCFDHCFKLSNLTFEFPSHLRELRSLPSWCSTCVDVPDSVELLSVVFLDLGRRLTVNFGEGSKLAHLTFEPPRTPIYDSAARSGARFRAFLRIPAHRLKALRGSKEFGWWLPASPTGNYQGWSWHHPVTWRSGVFARGGRGRL